MSEEGRNYVVILPCGCLCAAAHIEDRESDRVLLKEVAKWIRKGDNVQQMSTADVRSNPWGCEICKPKRRKEHTQPRLAL